MKVQLRARHRYFVLGAVPSALVLAMMMMMHTAEGILAGACRTIAKAFEEVLMQSFVKSLCRVENNIDSLLKKCSFHSSEVILFQPLRMSRK